MVAVAHAAPESNAPVAMAAWREGLRDTYGEADVAAFAEVLDYLQEHAGSANVPDGERASARGLGIANIVASLKLDPASIRAALLLPLAQLGILDVDAVTTRFGAEVASLVAGVARMDDIRASPVEANAEEREAQAEKLRKMLLAMVEDIRVVILKLAERTQALRYLMGGDEQKRHTAAREVVDLFAPLANRLGVWQLKWELEDLSLRALEPQTYKRIARLLDERRVDREGYIDHVVSMLRHELAAAGIRAEVTGRPKHIHSIWKKMQRKQSGIDALYDIRAVRVLVDEVKDCYAALGVVHQLWTPLAQEFDDYIAKPKANDYRSLHTAVIGPDDKSLEVQIRTRDMHQHSEFGVAAHWRYKEGKGSVRDPGFDEKISWLRQILEWKDQVAASGDWLSAFKSSLFTDSIYVLTPQGRVIDLPRGSTPVDFAYAVHTNLGHRCRGARVDGQMVPLDYKLDNGQQVEVITVKQGGPSRDWLNADLGYVASHRARAKVRQWFKAQQHDETVAQGRTLVERELARLGQTALKLDAVAAKAGFDKAEDFFAAYARDDINSKAVQVAIQAVAQPHAPLAAPAPEPAVETKASRAAGSGSGILVVGVDRLMTGLARCCKPAPPDAIVGFITRGKGVTIHRGSCSNVARIRETQPERLIEANWGAARDEVFPVDIVVEAMDRQGLLRDISEILSREKINVTAAKTMTKNLHSRMAFTVEVPGLEALKRALNYLREVPGVLAAGRR
jgi:GTP pyrophosphokinase